MEQIIETKNLTKRYGNKVVVDNVNIAVNKGDIYGLIGRNGAGKTTIIRMISGMTKQNKGNISLFGRQKLEKMRRNMGTIVEYPALYSHLTAKQNMMIMMKTLNVQDYKQIDKILELVGLKNNRQKVGKFSMGMKQRMAIGLSLIDNPECLILDEPTNGLDPQGIKEIRNLIESLNKNENITILISSHILSELSKFATRYGIINEGKLIDEFNEKELKERSRSKLILKVDKPNEAARFIQERFNIDQMEISRDDRIIIYEKIDLSEQINKELIKNDITVSLLTVVNSDLEEYFIDKIGGQN